MAILFLALILLSSCTKHNVNDTTNIFDCTGPAKSFSQDVKPIIWASCGSCHGPNSQNGPGSLTTYSEIFNAREALRSAVLTRENGNLTNEEKNKILCWIDNGAINN